MTLFNFFRRNKSAQGSNLAESVNDSIDQTTRTIDSSLFVDEQQPELITSLPQQESAIKLFLDQDFDCIGYNDGYCHPEFEFLDNRIKLIRADFRLAVDRTMEVKRIAMCELKMHAIKTSGISEKLELQVNEKIKQLEIVIHELDIQKILSIENEGMIVSAVYAYRLGFVRGLEKLQEEKFFAESTGLFNS